MMMNTSRVHPKKEQLIAFGLGTLESDEAGQIAAHLCECEDCSATIVNVQDDTFVSLIRSSASPADQLNQEINESQEIVSNVAADVESNLIGRDHSQFTGLPAELCNHPRYEILGLIGRGGMGDVYKAQHKVMNRVVALKVIKPELVSNDAAVERFQREVRAAASLRNANIVTAHDAEQAGNLHFLVMEYVDGDNLDEIVAKEGPLDVNDACQYIRQTAEGLQHAHDCEMVHRDIKPHNLMIEHQTGSIVSYDSIVKILDFGLANLANNAAEEAIESAETPKDVGAYDAQDIHLDSRIVYQLTQMGTMMGTPDYIAPEQAQDAHSADIRADIYSLGCTFFTLLTGRAPFAESSVLDKVKAHHVKEVPCLSNFRDDVPSEVEAVLQKMMAKDPAERYQSPAELVKAISDNCPQVEFPRRETTRVSPTRKRRSLALTVISTIFLAMVFSAGVMIYVATDTGTLVVDAEAGNLGTQIVLLKDGKEYASFDVQPGRSTQTIRAGRYEITLRGDTKDTQLKVTTAKDGKTQIVDSFEDGKRKILTIYRGGDMTIEIAKQAKHLAQNTAPKAKSRLPPWADNDLPFDASSFFSSPKKNAATLYDQAFNEFSPTGLESQGDLSKAQKEKLKRVSEREDRLISTITEFEKEPSSVDMADLKLLVQEFSDGLAQLRLAQQRAKCVFPVKLNGLETLTPSFRTAAALRVADVLKLKTFLDLQQPDQSSAITNIAILLRLARDLRPRGDVHNQICSCRLEEAAWKELVPQTLSSNGVTTADCDRMIAAIREHQLNSSIDPVLAAEQFDHIFWRQLLYQLENGEIDPEKVNREFEISRKPIMTLGAVLIPMLLDIQEFRLNSLALRRMIDDYKTEIPKEMLDKITADTALNEKFERVVAGLALTVGIDRMTELDYAIERRTLNRRYEQLKQVRQMSYPSRFANLERLNKYWTAGFPQVSPRVIGIFQQQWLNIVADASRRSDTQRRLAIASLAVKRWELLHGKRPATLEEAMKGINRTVPVDPYTGHPLKLNDHDGDLSGLGIISPNQASTKDVMRQ